MLARILEVPEILIISNKFFEDVKIQGNHSSKLQLTIDLFGENSHQLAKDL